MGPPKACYNAFVTRLVSEVDHISHAFPFFYIHPFVIRTSFLGVGRVGLPFLDGPQDDCRMDLGLLQHLRVDIDLFIGHLGVP